MAVQWESDLSGSINQRTPTLMKNNQYELLVNVSQQQIGTLAHRLGTTRFLDSLSASNISRGLGTYKKENASNYMHFVQGGDLYVNGATTWTSQATSVWNSSSEINMVNFINRHYMASSLSTEPVKWAIETGSLTNLRAFTATALSTSTGSTVYVASQLFSEGMVGMTLVNVTDTTTRTITAVAADGLSATLNSAINDTWDNDTITMYVYSKYLAVNGAYMMLSSNDIFTRRSYFTNVANENITFGTDYFETSEPPTGVASMGNGRTFIIFTPSTYMVVDPADFSTQETVGYGCVSHRSIQNIKGAVIWLDRKGFYLISPNVSYPTDISLPLKNEVTFDALFDKIDRGLMTVTAAGVNDTKYYCCVRDLSGNVKGEDLDSVVFEYDISMNSWKVHTYVDNDLGAQFTEFINSSGEVDLYSSSFSNATVYKMNVPSVYTDQDKDGTTHDVTSIIKTKHFDFVNSGDASVQMKNIKSFHLRYKTADEITVSYAKDGTSTYTQIGTNAVFPAYTTTLWTWDFMYLGKECMTISYDIRFDGNTVIYAIGSDVEALPQTGKKGR